MFKALDGHRTKIAGYGLIAIAILKVVVDLFDSGGFDLGSHVDELVEAFTGAGLIFLRDAIAKVKTAVDGNK